MGKLFERNSLKAFITAPFNYVLICAGIILRVKHFLENRPLGVDEAYTAVSITSRSLREIFTYQLIFSDQPQTPLFFTLIEKCNVLLLGNNEYVLRLFPLIAGILSLFLFYALLKAYVPQGAIPIALGFFSLCDPHVYLSAQVKPYTTDVLVILIIYMLIELIRLKKFTIWKARLSGVMGALLLWCSYPMMFVLTGVGLTESTACLVKREWAKLRKWAVVYLFWLCSFILLYRISLSVMLDTNFLIDEGLRLNNHFIQKIIWTKNNLLEAFKNPVGVSYPLAALVMFVWGGVQHYRRDRKQFFLLLLPILIVLLGALLDKYPFKERAILFSVPIFLIFIAQGILYLMMRKNQLSTLAGIIIMGMLLVHPVRAAVFYLNHPRDIAENRQAVEYIHSHFKKGDFILLNSSAQFPFWYYSGKLQFSKHLTKEYVEDLRGSYFLNKRVAKIYDQLGDYDGKVYSGIRYETHVYNSEGYFIKSIYDGKPKNTRLIHKNMSSEILPLERTWVFLAHIRPEVKNFILDSLDRQGRRVKSLEFKSSSVYLYDFL